jgi:uncharacterized protein
LHEVTISMFHHRWLLAIPLAFAVTIGSAAASSIRDEAGLFSADAVRQAEARLNEIEGETKVTTTIETIPSLDGQPINQVAVGRARAVGGEGLFILIPKQEHEIWILASRHYIKSITAAHRQAIEKAFGSSFHKGDFDAGLKAGVESIGRELTAAQAESGGHLRQAQAPPAGPIRGGRPMARPGGGSFGLSTLLMIGLVIIAVLVGIRLLGSLFGGGQRAYGPGAGQPGMGPGYGGPGYAPGYGGRGGGFFSSLLGGIGGAMAGNWLYDQFSGRHHGGSTYADNTGYAPDSDAAPTSGGDEWGGGAGTGGDWGGDAGGDAGGGGDWGGGGGGDWGGGGGGDWGGGGDGGSW